MGRQIVHKRGVFSRQIGRLDVIREKFKRIGRANVMLVATPRIASHFLDRVPPDANRTVLDRSKALDPILEQIIQPPAEAFRLLVSEIADVEGCILELPFELRSARFPPARHQMSKHGLGNDPDLLSCQARLSSGRLSKPPAELYRRRSGRRYARARKGEHRALNVAAIVRQH